MQNLLHNATAARTNHSQLLQICQHNIAAAARAAGVAAIAGGSRSPSCCCGGAAAGWLCVTAAGAGCCKTPAAGAAISAGRGLSTGCCAVCWLVLQDDRVIRREHSPARGIGGDASVRRDCRQQSDIARGACAESYLRALLPSAARLHHDNNQHHTRQAHCSAAEGATLTAACGLPARC